jgi:hypothetical protein
MFNKFFINEYLDKKVKEKYITKIIFSYLGNQCEKCSSFQKKKLTYVLSWSKGNHNLIDIPNNDYKLIKVCDNCLFSRCSSTQFYYEIPDKQCMF